MKVTISDIAKSVGVSTTTVSRYLNGNYEYMSYETRKKIEQAIKEYNYVPSNVARTLKSKRSKTVGIIVNTLRYQVAAQTLMGINDVCIEHGYGTVIYSTDDDPEKEQRAIQMCLNQQIDGVVIIPSQTEAKPYLDIAKTGIPVVLCTRSLEDWPYSSVYVKHDEMIRNMLRHLKEEGFEKVHFLLDVPTFHKRWMGAVFAQEAKTLFDMEQEDSIVFVGREDPKIQAVLDAFRSKYPNEKKAVMAVNTHTLFLLLKEIERQEIQVPTELGVCGYDSIGWSELVHPGISAMQQPMRQMGMTAGKELMRCIQEKSNGNTKHGLSGINYYRASTKLIE